MSDFSDFFKNNMRVILLLGLTIFIFISIAYYYYTYIVQPKLNKKYIDNKEFVSEEDSNDSKNATLYLFYTNWCPHCKNAKDEWSALKTVTNGSVKDVNILFEEIDCDVDTALADKFKIEGYPTIKLFYNNKMYDYDAKPSKENLTKFLNDVL